MDNLPTEIFFEDTLYYKWFDGHYYKFPLGEAIKPENCIGMISAAEMRSIIENTTFKKQVLYLTDNIHKKL